jgi:hypothetical protein
VTERHDNRGRHRRATSPETAAWHRFLAEKEWLQLPGHEEPVAAIPTMVEPVLPARPPWLDEAEYEALLELRERLT